MCDSEKRRAGSRGEAERSVECEAECARKVVKVVNRMHLGEGVNTQEGKGTYI